MFQSLYSRLALVLLGVFLAMGLLLAWLFEQATLATHNEASQRLHLDLAQNIVSDLGITSEGEFDAERIKQAFHQMMILGPTIELYVVDDKGNLVTYDAPEEKIKQRIINLQPIKTFVERKDELPILGDDPRSTEKMKIFSAAPVYARGIGADRFLGYLYIIIGGENYDSVATALRLGKTLKISLVGIASALVFLLLASLLLFYALTRPLRRLTQEISAFEHQQGDKDDELASESDSRPRSEIDQLKGSFTQMKRRIVNQLERLNRQDQIRREFLAFVSHDLRTPLAALKASLETLDLKLGSLPPGDQRKILQKAIMNGDRLEGMINELFELTRLESGQVRLDLEEFPIGDLLSDSFSALEKKAQDAGVRLTMRCDDPTVLVLADIAKIERVLQNLVENAIRYSPRDADVVVHAGPADKQSVSLEIRDSGTGIPGEDLSHIFEPYFRVAGDSVRTHKGAGLGLAISQRLLALHQVELKVESKRGEGTVFRFNLQSGVNQAERFTKSL